MGEDYTGERARIRHIMSRTLGLVEDNWGGGMVTPTVSSEPSTLREQVLPDSSRRIGFRFAVVYLGLYCFFTQILISLIPVQNISWVPTDLSRVPPFRGLVLGTATHVFRVATTPNYADTGSGDTLFDWVSLCCLLVMAAVGTATWVALDRKCLRYDAVAKWFRLSIRLCLAGQMISYGLAKVIPLQMPFPNLYRLVEPYGNLSPMGVLWASIGASPAYEIFAGSAELLGGILLLLPRTTTFGALICLADMTQVFMLNMSYDVPVKLLSFHLILLAVVLLVPDFSRLMRFFFLNDVTEAPRNWDLFPTRKANRIAFAVQILFGASLVASNLYGNLSAWHEYGGGSPKSELYGIWDIDELVIDGKSREPLTTDKQRWRRAIFEFQSATAFQRMDDSLGWYRVTLNSKDQTLSLTKRDDKNWQAHLAYKRGPVDRLEMDGTVDGHPTHMVLRLKDRNQYLIVSRGFHWISETPFNR